MQPFDRTYEGLKPRSQVAVMAAIRQAFDRTYEGLKPRLLWELAQFEADF